MSGEITTTVIGNLTADPKLTYTKGDNTVANFTIASTPRQYKDGEWKDGDPVFLRCQLWGQPAENITESLDKGARVIATGRLVQRSYEKDGDKRTIIELIIDEIGPSLKFRAAKITQTTNGDQPSPTKSKQRTQLNVNDEPPF